MLVCRIPAGLLLFAFAEDTLQRLMEEGAWVIRSWPIFLKFRFWHSFGDQPQFQWICVCHLPSGWPGFDFSFKYGPVFAQSIIMRMRNDASESPSPYQPINFKLSTWDFRDWLYTQSLKSAQNCVSSWIKFMKSSNRKIHLKSKFTLILAD